MFLLMDPVEEPAPVTDNAGAEAQASQAPEYGASNFVELSEQFRGHVEGIGLVDSERSVRR